MKGVEEGAADVPDVLKEERGMCQRGTTTWVCALVGREGRGGSASRIKPVKNKFS